MTINIDAKDFELLRDQNAEGGDIDGQMSMLNDDQRT